MKKGSVFFIFGLFLVCVLFIFSTASAKTVIKFGHVAPTFHGQSVGADHFAKYVMEKTNGEVEVRTYPMGQLGGERSMAEQVQSGTLQVAAITCAVLSNFVPQAALIPLPFVFPDRRTAYAVLDSEIRDKLFSYFPAKGFMALGFTENEFRDLSNSKRPIRKPEDLKGLKIRLMESPVYLDTFRQMGVNPVPMPFPEVYNALQQGVIDGQDNPLYTSILMKFTEVNKYVTITHHILTECPIVANIDWWNTLPAKYQKILREAAYETEVVNRGHTMRDKLSMSVMAKKDPKTGKVTPGPSIYAVARKQGVQIIELTPSEREAFKEAMTPVYKKYRDIIGPDLFDAFMAKIKEINKYRKP
jgi:tripartite ATP-independent transporter DctP family solute receptor